MFPAIMLVQTETDLHERPPLRPLRFPDQMYARFLRRVIGLPGIALDAGAHNVFPRRWPAAIAWDDMIQIQVLAFEQLPAVLAHVLVALENVMPGELYLFLRQMVVDHQQNYARDADPERHRADRFRMRFLLREIVPLLKAVGLKRTVRAVQNGLGMAL